MRRILKDRILSPTSAARLAELEKLTGLPGKTCCQLVGVSACTYSYMRRGINPLGLRARKVDELLRTIKTLQKNGLNVTNM